MDHIAVDGDECVLYLGHPSREGDSPGGVERFGFHGVEQLHPGAAILGIGGLECIRPITERQNRSSDPLLTQTPHHMLDHGPVDNRKHLFWTGQGKRPKSGAESADQNNRVHVSGSPGSAAVFHPDARNVLIEVLVELDRPFGLGEVGHQ